MSDLQILGLVGFTWLDLVCDETTSRDPWIWRSPPKWILLSIFAIDIIICAMGKSVGSNMILTITGKREVRWQLQGSLILCWDDHTQNKIM